jgi:hypothetical protein
MDLRCLKLVWQGGETPSYTIAAIIGTLAIALKFYGKAQIQSKAYNIANKIWDKGNPVKFSKTCLLVALIILPTVLAFL